MGATARYGRRYRRQRAEVLPTCGRKRSRRSFTNTYAGRLSKIQAEAGTAYAVAMLRVVWGRLSLRNAGGNVRARAAYAQERGCASVGQARGTVNSTRASIRPSQPSWARYSPAMRALRKGSTATGCGGRSGFARWLGKITKRQNRRAGARMLNCSGKMSSQ